MFMQDWVDELDKFAGIYGKGVLKDSGKVSRNQANTKATKEFRTYQTITLSSVESSYLESVKTIEKIALQKVKGGKKQ